jgi:hypothetical protein
VLPAPAGRIAGMALCAGSGARPGLSARAVSRARDRPVSQLRDKLHAAIDRAAAAAQQYIRQQAAAHRAALAGKSFNRSLGQLRRHATEKK